MELKQTKIYLNNKIIVDEPRFIGSAEVSLVCQEYNACVMHVLQRRTSEYIGLQNVRKELIEYKMEAKKCQQR